MKDFFNTKWSARSGIEKAIILIVGVVLLYLAYRLVRSFLDREKTKNLQSQLSAELAAQEQVGLNKSYPDSQYQSWATTLYNSMQSDWYNPFDWGTDEETVLNIMSQMQNSADITSLLSAFGSRDGYDLAGWIKSEVSQWYIDQINNLFANKSINYRL